MHVTSPDARFELREEVAFRVAGGQAILVDLRSGKCWELNPVATEIWRSLSERTAIGQIVEEVSARYPHASDRVAQDVAALIRELSSAGLIRAAPDPG